MSSGSNKTIVVTVRCIDMSSYGRDLGKELCSKCGEMVWLSPSWRGKKIDQIICDKCFFKNNDYKKDDYTVCTTEENLDEAVKCVREYFDMKGTDEELKEKMIREVENRIRKKIRLNKKIE